MEVLNLHNKCVLMRVDFNVPVKDGVIQNAARIEATLASIEQVLAQDAKLILVSHLGRPQSKNDLQYSLAPVASYLEEALSRVVQLASNWQAGVSFQKDEIILLENIRFCEGETQNAPELSKQLAKLADVFIMNAFATAHRKHASTYGVANYVKQACIGPLMQQEINALNKVLKDGKAPIMAIVGGAKVSTKLKMLYKLLDKVQILILGGGIANTFLLAQGFEVGGSLVESNLIEEVKRILSKAAQNKITIGLPEDVIVGKDFNSPGEEKLINSITAKDAIFDVGAKTMQNYAKMLKKANTILWNGPLGVFESEYYCSGSKALAQEISASNAYKVAGGGDTVALIENLDIKDSINYISTGGGAFLYYLEHESLPIEKLLGVSY